MVLTRNNLDWWCERGILCLVLGLVSFAAAAFGATETWSLAVVQAGTIPVLVLWGLRLWLSERPKLLWPPVAWAVLGFMGLAVARYFTADIEWVARQELMQVLLCGFLFFAVLNNLRGQDNTETSTLVLLILGTLIAGYAAGQLASHSNHVWNHLSPYHGRASGTFISPNALAGFLGLLLPLTVAFLLVGKLSTQARVLLGYAAALMVVALVATFSRGGWVSAGAGVFLVLGILLGHANHRLKALVLLVLLLGGGVFFADQCLSKSPVYMRRVAQPDANEPGVVDFHYRLEVWRTAVQMWQDHFWFGAGPAHYNYCFGPYRQEDNQFQPLWVHNDYLNLLAEWGLAGAAVVLAGAGLFLFGLFKTWPHVRREENIFGSAQSNRFAFFLGAAGGLAALAVHSTTDYNLHVPAIALLAATLLALASGQIRYVSEGYWARSKPGLRWGACALLAGGAAAFAWDLSRRIPEAYYLARADAVEEFSDASIAALKKAFAAEPADFQTAYRLGEHHRKYSFDGGPDYAEQARLAIGWYAVAARLNPHSGNCYMRTGMCLDWLGRHEEAEAFFRQAELCDPNSQYLVGKIGWHFMETGDFAAAREWFRRALRLGDSQGLAAKNLGLCEARLAEQASGKLMLPPGF